MRSEMQTQHGRQRQRQRERRRQHGQQRQKQRERRCDQQREYDSCERHGGFYFGDA
jgi:hypothetical protein